MGDLAVILLSQELLSLYLSAWAPEKREGRLGQLCGAGFIQLLEYPIPARPVAVSQKPSSADISETENGIIK